MKKHLYALLTIGVLMIGWVLISPLFINEVVDEDFPELTTESLVEIPEDAPEPEPEPFLPADMDELLAALPDEEAMAAMTPEELEVERLRFEAAAETLPDVVMTETIPETVFAGPQTLRTGEFMGTDNFHQGSGSATIYQLEDSSRIVRFEDFEVTNGPDLRVLLVNDTNPAGRLADGSYIELGKLKGNQGNQNYDIPDGVDLTQYNSVVIYCKPFHVLFAVAPLSSL